MPENASLLIKNAVIHSFEDDLPPASAMLIQKGVITALGDWHTISQLAANCPVLDAQGAVAFPGFIDSHMHFEFSGQIQSSLNLADATCIHDLLEKVQKAARNLPAGRLIFGTQMDDSKLQENRYPTLAELDLAAPSHPVLLIHRTGHSSVMNSLALRLASIPAQTPGFEMDEDGKPNGLLLAQANSIGQANLEPIIKELASFDAIVQNVTGEAVRAGLTTLHALDDPEFFRKLLPILPELPLHIVCYPQTRSIKEAQSLGLPRIGGCGHSGLDGDIGSQKTAALLEPYASDPSTDGALYFEDEELRQMVLEAHRQGMQVCMHAVGDRAVAQGLMAVEFAQSRYPRPDARHRIEHWEVFNAGLAQQAARLGVMVGIQPPFNHFWPHHTDYPQHVGAHRFEQIDPIADLIASGLVVAGGSDSPVTPLSPLLGVHSAVNHSNPRQRISALEALKMYTIQCARIAFEEAVKGTLKPGKYGNLTLLREDPCLAEPASIKDIQVLYTIVKGKVVYSA